MGNNIRSRILGAAANRIEARQEKKKAEGGQRLARYDAKTQSYVYLDGSPVQVAQVLTDGAIADGQIVSATKGFIDAPVTAIERRTERKKRRAKTGEGIAYIYTKTVQVNRPGTVFHGRDYTGIFFVDRQGNTKQLDGEITVLYRLEDELQAHQALPQPRDVVELKVERQCPFFAVSVSWYPIAPTGGIAYNLFSRQSTHALRSTIDESFNYFLGGRLDIFIFGAPSEQTSVGVTSYEEMIQMASSGSTLSPHVVKVEEAVQPETYVCATTDLDFFFFRVKVNLTSLDPGVVRHSGGSITVGEGNTSWGSKTGTFFFVPVTKDDRDPPIRFYPELGEFNLEKYPGLINPATISEPLKGWGFEVDSGAPFGSSLDNVWVMAWARQPRTYVFFDSHGVHDWRYFFARRGSTTDLSLDQDDPSDESTEDWRFPSQVYDEDPDWDDPCFEQFAGNKFANVVGDTVFSVTTPLRSITDLETPVNVQARLVTRSGNSCSLGTSSTAQIKLKVLLPADSTVVAAAVIL